MSNSTTWTLLCLFTLLSACGTDGSEEVTTISYPHEVTLSAEQALVAPTGEVLDGPEFLAADLVTYSSSTIKLSTGCPEESTHCKPLHICRQSQFSKPTHYNRLQDVCAEFPEGMIQQSIPNAEAGMGFVLETNTEEGVMKFLVKSVQGSGRQATVTLEYMPAN